MNRSTARNQLQAPAAVALLFALSCAGAAPAPHAAVPAQPSAAASSPPAAAPVKSPLSAMSGARIIEMLDQAIEWYRTLGIQQQAASEPSDILILYDNRQTATQVIALAFDIARTNADILAKQPGPRDAVAGSQSAQNLSQLQDKFSAQGVAVQAELDSEQLLLVNARPDEKVALQAKVAELREELDLINARKSLVATLSMFASQTETGGFSPGALKAQIEAMAVTVPSAANSASPNSAAGAASGNSAAAPSAAVSSLGGAGAGTAARFGIWDLGANVVRLSEKIAAIDAIDQRTAALQTMFAQLRAPLIVQLKAMSARGDSLATQADSADSATLDRVRDQLDALAGEFKLASALVIPLSKEDVLLNQYRRTIGNWRDAVKSQYGDALKTLGVRLGVIGVLLILVFAAAEIWRRAVMRYIQDSRRRYQFLLLRRITLWCVVFIIIGFALASELGSIVTFAGLITAGLAVAMQSVLVSIVGYFFLIGKYGIRIGDRVQIGEVTGEVIELGLVRLYLMELGGHGSLGPTGRVVAFANSIVFQVSSGLFRQIHGVNFTWREIVVSLAAGVDYAAAKEKLLSAVTNAIKDYRDEILQQTREIQRASASGSGDDAQPRVQLSFSASGADAHIRYPVRLQNAAEVDERVSQAVYAVIAKLTPGPQAARPA